MYKLWNLKKQLGSEIRLSSISSVPPTHELRTCWVGTVLGGWGRAINKATRSALKELRSGEKETNTEDAPTAPNGSFGRRPHTRARQGQLPSALLFQLPSSGTSSWSFAPNAEPHAQGLPVTPLIWFSQLFLPNGWKLDDPPLISNTLTISSGSVLT